MTKANKPLEYVVPQEYYESVVILANIAPHIYNKASKILAEVTGAETVYKKDRNNTAIRRVNKHKHIYTQTEMDITEEYFKYSLHSSKELSFEEESIHIHSKPKFCNKDEYFWGQLHGSRFKKDQNENQYAVMATYEKGEMGNTKKHRESIAIAPEQNNRFKAVVLDGETHKVLKTMEFDRQFNVVPEPELTKTK